MRPYPCVFFHLSDECVCFSRGRFAAGTLAITDREHISFQPGDFEALEQGLRRIKSQFRLTNWQKNIFGIIPRSWVLLRTFEAAIADSKFVKEEVLSQALGKFPYSADELSLDVLSGSYLSEQIYQATVAAVPHTVILPYLRVFQNVGFEFDSLSVSTHGLLYWAWQEQKSHLLPQLLVHLTDDTTEICLWQESSLLYSRGFPNGRLADKTADLEYWKMEMERTFHDLRKGHLGFASCLLLLTRFSDGHKEILNGLVAKEHVELSVQHADAVVESGEIIGDRLKKFNLLPISSQIDRQRKEEVRWLTRMSVCLAGLLLFVTLGISVFAMKDRALAQQLEQKIEQGQERVKGQEQQMKQLRFWAGRARTRDHFQKVMQIISGSFPNGMALSLLSWKEDVGVQFQGLALSSQQIQAFHKGLLDSGLFEQVRIASIQRREYHNKVFHEFEVVCHVRAEE